MLRRAIALFLTILAFALIPLQAQASETLTIDIFGPGQSRVNMALTQALPLAEGGQIPPEAEIFEKYVTENLDMLPFLRMTPAADVLGGVNVQKVTSDGIDFRRFSVSKVDLVMTMGWQPGEGRPGRLEVRVYETFSARLVVGKAYRVTRDSLARAADMFCSHFMEALTGHGEFFRSVLAFTKQGQGNAREVWTMTPQGRELRQITFFGGSSISPAWSPDGRYLAFAHHGSSSHTLGVWDKSTNRIFRTKLPGTTIGGTAFDPEGNVAVALSRGNMEIFRLTRDLTRIKETLVKSWAIDVSPSFDAVGKRMAFVSDRRGNPQVFVKDLATGKENRLTFEGKYNTSPSISPDGKLVVFSRRTKSGHRIFVMDVDTGRERQITFGPGNDEEPAFSPDGYFVAFSSNRTGKYQLYLTTRHGDEPRKLKTGKGAVTHPTFGPRLF
ncbi:PD40 domain-containing protein [Desulfovibrio ferrophilus]|uniref:Tol-Pal system beta propeller repeat protein TolB n=1 Tax=Desulfovibrio ferrophilus TaxID=241368 RepID=A0A2Z6AYT8_9BACT|nr:PD40 domain-containing protein [Desulfovibrio ferrophilus]BBD08335.1 Tol-Pal system beta propeller repeat protein TolB [Desulfovibrio ferrophilus]